MYDELVTLIPCDPHEDQPAIYILKGEGDQHSVALIDKSGKVRETKPANSLGQAFKMVSEVLLMKPSVEYEVQ